MGNYSDTALDRDRAFDTEDLSSLITQGKNLPPMKQSIVFILVQGITTIRLQPNRECLVVNIITRIKII